MEQSLKNNMLRTKIKFFQNTVIYSLGSSLSENVKEAFIHSTDGKLNLYKNFIWIERPNFSIDDVMWKLLLRCAGSNAMTQNSCEYFQCQGEYFYTQWKRKATE